MNIRKTSRKSFTFFYIACLLIYSTLGLLTTLLRGNKPLNFECFVETKCYALKREHTNTEFPAIHCCNQHAKSTKNKLLPLLLRHRPRPRHHRRRRPHHHLRRPPSKSKQKIFLHLTKVKFLYLNC